MALTVKPLRSFVAIPTDLRQWSNWIRETLTEALQGLLVTDQITDLAVTTAKVNDLAVTTGKIAALAVTTAKIDADAVTFAKMQNIAVDTLIGRATAGTGDPETVACTAAGRALIDDASASAQRTTLGLGTAAVENIGTSGANVPKLSTANTWTLAQTFSAPPIVPSYTVGTLPSATPAGQLIYVSNETGGAVLAFSDATNFRRVTDRAIVS
jgi:hypothetical protein